MSFMESKISEFCKLVKSVGEWSKRNFGEQTDGKLVLGRFAPLLGLVEEIGELSSSYQVKDGLDSIADIHIYLCDYIARATDFDDEQIAEIGRLIFKKLSRADELLNENNSCDDLWEFDSDLVSAVGRLYHVELKRLQGIRGFHCDECYRSRRNHAILNVVHNLQKSISDYRVDAWLLASIVFDEVVSKRNWAIAPNTGETDGVDGDSDSSGDNCDEWEAVVPERPPIGL